ncbi:DUF1549 and DUF1553 domain-containing protein [Bryobacter aggregatus]|uniref:DUF1549 and DUF1553 domain-containing protein n=1 Tax=Bryobacter aggregatus TaxID=360054 RepID=UPI00069130B2|nr:DUF1549 and DUF1553 domain-containing protein [Bryobacter aggregatus]
MTSFVPTRIVWIALAALSLHAADPPKETVAEQFAKRAARLWSLQPVVKPVVPVGVSSSNNPIDALIGAVYQEKGLQPVGKADKLTILRRVYFDLIGLPPTPAEQDAFLSDESPEAYAKVVDRLLEDKQHGVRWARHWLDVLRYADLDGLDGSVMPAAGSVYLWRDWMISALNRDMPYDGFVRAQILGNRYQPEIATSNGGRRTRVEGPVSDTFALGFLARAALNRGDKDRDVPFAAVETISTAFMGVTVACAKCHDHKFDPITQRDFYAMKAIFDPLVLKNTMLATPSEIFEHAEKLDEYKRKKAPVDAAIEALVGSYRTKLFDERVAQLTPDVQAIVRKAERDRTEAEQKIFDDYFPVIRIDASKIKEIMPKEEVAKYNALLKEQGAIRNPAALPSYWTVEEDKELLKAQSYILNTGDPNRPEKDHPVEPGFPFQPKDLDFRDGRREAFTGWLTDAKNPLFARVAVNRIWAWHFGEGLHRVTSDFGVLGGRPTNQKLLDYLAAEFVAHNYSMKWLHRLIVSSDTYQLSSKADAKSLAANTKADARNSYLWRFRLQRLEAEPIWDALHYVSNDLDLSIGGKSFQLRTADQKQAIFLRGAGNTDNRTNRRGIYLTRGYIPSTDVMSNFLTSFDVDDGRTPCPIRTQTVTAPQALFTMNNDLIEQESRKLAERVLQESKGDLRAAVTLAYRLSLGRPPSGVESDQALTYVANDAARLPGLAWLLFNLDEFIYVR